MPKAAAWEGDSFDSPRPFILKGPIPQVRGSLHSCSTIASESQSLPPDWLERSLTLCARLLLGRRKGVSRRKGVRRKGVRALLSIQAQNIGQYKKRSLTPFLPPNPDHPIRSLTPLSDPFPLTPFPPVTPFPPLADGPVSAGTPENYVVPG